MIEQFIIQSEAFEFTIVMNIKASVVACAKRVTF